MKDNYIVQAWLVVVLALGFGAALAGVETWLKPRIEANKLTTTIEKIPLLIPGADEAASGKAAKDGPVILTIGQGREQARYDAFRALTADGEQIGWVVKASGKGFADKIELLIGLDAQVFAIQGLSILDHKETPGLGDKIEKMGTEKKKGFLWQFAHYAFEANQPLTVTTASPKSTQMNTVKAVAGATISSQSVSDIINEALSKELRDKLADAAKRYNRSRAAGEG